MSKGPKDEKFELKYMKAMLRLTQSIESATRELAGLKRYNDERSREAQEIGPIEVHRYRNYYDVKNTIKKSGPIDPEDFDSPVYNRERVYKILERYSNILHVINDDPKEPLFVVVSHEGETNFSKEAVIYPKEIKDYYWVYELRLRSAKAGHKYRVTEYAIMTVSSGMQGDNNE